MDIAEIGKISAINKLFEGSGYDSNQEAASVHKLYSQGIDFDLTYNPLRHLGYKMGLSVVGELYASFCKPKTLSVLVAISNRHTYEDVQKLWDGIVAAAKEHGVETMSLDLLPSNTGLSVSLSATGTKIEFKEQVQVNNFDVICLTGDVGAAYMGLNVLEREKIAFNNMAGVDPKQLAQPDLTKYKYILESYLSPFVNKNILTRFSESGIVPSKGYFVTKGLAAAVNQLSSQTRFGAKIYLDKIPISSATFSMAEELNIDAVTAALNGGDDYKFIFVIPIAKAEKFRVDFQDFDIIGHLAQPEVGTVLVTPQGAEIELKDLSS